MMYIFRNHYVPMKDSMQVSMKILTDFKKEMQGTKIHARHSVRVQVHAHPFLLNTTNTIYIGKKLHYYNRKKKTCHVTIVVIFPSRLLEIGDHQRPHTIDIVHNVHSMRRAQIVCDYGFLQGRERRQPISCLSAFQQNFK